jgi:hypothetical protein
MKIKDLQIGTEFYFNELSKHLPPHIDGEEDLKSFVCKKLDEEHKDLGLCSLVMIHDPSPELDDLDGGTIWEVSIPYSDDDSDITII